MIINHNLNAMNSHRNLVMNTAAQGKSIEKLSSGLRINRAGDDAAGLAISEKMRGQIRGLDQASRNAQDTISLIQTAEGALNETHSILQRMRELAVQASNDTNTDADRTSIQDEINQLTAEIDRIASTTEFNTKKLLNGDRVGVKGEVAGTADIEGTFANGTVKISGIAGISAVASTDVIRINVVKLTGAGSLTETANSISVTTALGGMFNVVLSDAGHIVISDSVGSTTYTLNITNLNSAEVGDTITISLKKYEAAKTDSSKALRAQIGANSGQELTIGINDMSSLALSIRKTDGTALSVKTQSEASASIKLINNALETVSTERSKLGAFQNRLEHTINNLNTASENLQASESRIRDVDMAKEMMNQTKNSILSQAAQAMLAQANQAPQGVLQLLR